MRFVSISNISSWLLASFLAMVCFSMSVSAGEEQVASPVIETQVGLDGGFRPSGYRLGAGDVLTIRVYGEDDLTREKLRLPDSGVVSFPFGDLMALGMTVSNFEAKIADGLRGRFLVNPRVSISIEEYRPFFIYGQVEKPGGYPFQPGLNVRKAVSLAGGFKERASLSKIFVVREGGMGNRAEKIDLNTSVWPGDTVTVEESFF
ncbi:MAG: polysaccharide export protein [Gallionella sp.]|nr:polysaccharide export protein [Gallionella sp.]